MATPLAVVWMLTSVARLLPHGPQFAPPSPFTLDELDPAGILPDRVYTQAELLVYLAHGREKWWRTLLALTDEQGQRLCPFPWGELSFAELLLYNMRHVQHHVAQLNLLLRQEIDSAPRWVARVQSEQERNPLAYS